MVSGTPLYQVRALYLHWKMRLDCDCGFWFHQDGPSDKGIPVVYHIMWWVFTIAWDLIFEPVWNRVLVQMTWSRQYQRSQAAFQRLDLCVKPYWTLQTGKVLVLFLQYYLFLQRVSLSEHQEQCLRLQIVVQYENGVESGLTALKVVVPWTTHTSIYCLCCTMSLCCVWSL